MVTLLRLAKKKRFRSCGGTAVSELDDRIEAMYFRSIEGSLASYGSAIKGWLCFCSILNLNPLAASAKDMLRYVATHRHAPSAAKYLTAIRWLYASCECDITWESNSLKLMMRGFAKASAPTKKAPALSWAIVSKLVVLAWRSEPLFALAYVLASVFLLRVGDELIPLMHNSLADHSAIGVLEESSGHQFFFIRLRSRKNESLGVCLKRRCSCSSTKEVAVLCPVHAFLRFMKWQGPRRFGKVFPGFNQRSFQRALRAHLQQVNEVALAEVATSHGFRRGSAQELLKSKTPMAQILQAGGWKSPAFLEYLDKEEIDCEAILELCCEDETSAPPNKKPPKATKVCPSKQWGDIRDFCIRGNSPSRQLPSWMDG